MIQRTANSEQRTERNRLSGYSLFAIRYSLPRRRGFTLIETMVAISLLMVALLAPMSLASQSLTAAYYSREQITAFYLAQEGIEIVRSVRDANIIAIAEGNSSVSDVFNGIPYGQSLAQAKPFTVDTLQPNSSALQPCPASAPSSCPPLMTNGSLYGYSDDASGAGWTTTTFDRSVIAYLTGGIPGDQSQNDELRVTVTVTWQQGSFQTQSFTISEDLYQWVSSS